MNIYSKTMVITIVIFFIGAGIVPSIADSPDKTYVVEKNMLDEVDQSQTEHDSAAVVCSWYIWAQSFVPTKETLTGVELLLGRIGFIRSDIKVTIRNDLNGEDLATATMPYNSVPLIWRLFIGFPDWIYFDFPDISVLPGETYYITLYTDGGFGLKLSLLSSYRWSVSWNPDSYLNGEGWFSNVMGDIPTPWKIWDQPFDFCFKTLSN